jgi:hypothetical protein
MLDPQSNNCNSIPKILNSIVKNKTRNISNSNNQESIDNNKSNKIIIGETSECVGPSCRGLLVDSVIGKYYIRCSDNRHDHGLMEIKNQEAGFSTQTKTTASNNNHIARIRPGDYSE